VRMHGTKKSAFRRRVEAQRCRHYEGGQTYPNMISHECSNRPDEDRGCQESDRTAETFAERLHKLKVLAA